MAKTRVKDEQNAGRLVIVCDWLPPEFGAVGQYMLDYARARASAGADVEIIGLSRIASPATTERFGDGRLTVRRLRARTSSKRGIWRRGVWALGTNVALLRAAGRAVRSSERGEIIVTGSPPFLSSLALLTNALWWRQRTTYRITDFYPETVLAAGKAPWLRLLAPPLKRIRALADRIEVLGHDQERRLREDGVNPARIVLRRDPSPVAVPPTTEPLPSPFEPGTLILLYSGNLGVAHTIDAICEAYRRHVRQGANRVRLWMNGQGTRVDDLRAYCRAHGLPLHVTPPASLGDLPRLLATADAHLILLGDAFWGYVLPSKVYGCIASGKPILFVGPTESDVDLLLRETGDSRHGRVRTAEGAFAFLEELAGRAGGPDHLIASVGNVARGRFSAETHTPPAD